MFGTNDIDITLYFVGTDVDDAQQNFPFDSQESAESFVFDQGKKSDLKVFSAQGMIDLTTLEEVQ